MPQFNAGVSKTAKVTMRNPAAKAFDYEGVILMGTGLTEISRVAFHLDAGQSKDISFPVTMPSVAGTYPVYIGVFSGGVSIALYKATEDVVIAAPTGPIHCSLINAPAIAITIPPSYPGYPLPITQWGIRTASYVELAPIGSGINLDISYWGNPYDIELFAVDPYIMGLFADQAWYLPQITYVPGATYVFNWAARTITRV